MRSRRIVGRERIQGGDRGWLGCNGFDVKGLLRDCWNLKRI